MAVTAALDSRYRILVHSTVLQHSFVAVLLLKDKTVHWKHTSLVQNGDPFRGQVGNVDM